MFWNSIDKHVKKLTAYMFFQLMIVAQLNDPLYIISSQFTKFIKSCIFAINGRLIRHQHFVTNVDSGVVPAAFVPGDE